VHFAIALLNIDS